MRLLQLIWPFLVTVLLLLLALAYGSFQLMSAGRAYVHGESLWSKSQKNAIQFLARYSESCDRHDFEQYQAAMAIPMGDRIARLELLQPAPSWPRVTTGFLQGGNHPDDIPGMIMLFRQFGSMPLLFCIGPSRSGAMPSSCCCNLMRAPRSSIGRSSPAARTVPRTTP